MKDTTLKYTYLNHPDFVSDKPGKCSCGTAHFLLQELVFKTLCCIHGSYLILISHLTSHISHLIFHLPDFLLYCEPKSDRKYHYCSDWFNECLLINLF